MSLLLLLAAGLAASAADPPLPEGNAHVRGLVDRQRQRAEERPGARLLVILERFDFRTAGREDIDSRSAIVFDFAAQPGKRDIEGDAALRHLTGRLWVDEAEREIVRAEIRNREPIKLAWGLGATVSRLEIRTDFRKIDGGAWLPVRDETLARA